MLLDRWAYNDIPAGGRAEPRIELYDLKNGTKTILASGTSDLSSSPRYQSIFSASMGGDSVAWIEQPSPTDPRTLVLLDLKTGTRQRISTPWAPSNCYLMGDGGHFLCDAEHTLQGDPTRKAVITAKTGEAVELTRDHEFRMPVGMRVSLANFAGIEHVGVYDATTNDRRLVHMGTGRP